MAKVLCVLYDDPVSGHPESYARDGIPKIEHYPGGQTTPSPKQIDFKGFVTLAISAAKSRIEIRGISVASPLSLPRISPKGCLT